MVIFESALIRLIIITCISIIAHATQDMNRISANFNRKVYRRWNSRPLELCCPFSSPSRQLWYSSNAIFKAAFGCLNGADLSLFLTVFPDVVNITFIGLNTSHQAVCTFRLMGELIEAYGVLSSSGSNDNGLFEVEIFSSPGAFLTFNTTICKTGIVRNGSCSSWDALGTSFTGEQVNRRHSDHFGVRYTVQARDGDRHQCMGSIDGRTHSFAVRVKSDLDECEAAAAESIQLCRGECKNLFPSYRCSNDSYSIPCTDFKTDGWMCLPEERLYYPPSSVELDGVGTCELTANEGHHFCPLGAMDCIDSPYGPKCRSELRTSLVEAAPKLGFNEVPSPGFRHSKEPPVDLNLLLRKASTDKNLTYLVQKSVPLLWQNSGRWIETLSNVTKETVQRISSTLFEERSEVSSENFLQSIEVLMNAQAQRQTATESSHPMSERTSIEKSAVTAFEIVQSASALLNVFSALSGDQDSPGSAINIADEYTVQRNGLELRRIQLNRNQSDTQNESTVMHSLTTSSGSSTALMVTIPLRKLEPFLERSNDSKFTKINASFGDASFINLDSDVFIIHTSDLIGLFQVKMASKKERKEDATCRIWDMLNTEGNAFESHTCQTYWIDGRYYECRCTPSRSGTFAVGLVYIMSSKDLKNLKNYGPAITIVNYVSSVITVVALSLFLFFTRFVGVFRLDQFHIALSLLLGTLVSLFIPHVPEDFEFLCAVIAVLVNYFPLCAFAWKFVFGLNALLMIVAPNADFNDIFALRIVYIPVTVCAYIGPALIVGLWFGMARQFKSGLGLCIGPDLLGYRWPLLAPITAVVLFNLLVLTTVGFVVLRNYLAIRRNRVNKSTHLLVLAQLMLTLGIPYMLIYIQIISPVFMLLILPIGIALTAVFMFLLVAIIDDENRQLLCLFLTTMCASGHQVNKYPGSDSNGRVNIPDTIKSTTLSSPDAFVVTDAGHPNHMITTSSANNSTSHEYFARSRSRFAMEGDLTTGILRHPINGDSSGVADEFKSAAVLVPLEVTQLPTQYYYNPQSPHHNAPVIRFESLHDLVMAPTSELNDAGRIIQTPMPEVAYSEGIGTQHFYPKSRKQFVNKATTSPKLVNSYHMDSKSGGF